MAERVTRGHGLLEGFLARRRAAMAGKLLAGVPREGHLLDVGCGTHPLFLLRSDFRQRTGVDRVLPADGTGPAGVTLLPHDFEAEPSLPFEDRSFDAVTMLAVFEHVDPAALTPLLSDIRRVLRPGGILVLTTPASWTDPILRTLAALRLVSHEEIDEHKDAYDHQRIRQRLLDAGFAPERLRFGSFELFTNLWATALA